MCFNVVSCLRESSDHRMCKQPTVETYMYIYVQPKKKLFFPLWCDTFRSIQTKHTFLTHNSGLLNASIFMVSTIFLVIFFLVMLLSLVKNLNFFSSSSFIIFIRLLFVFFSKYIKTAIFTVIHMFTNCDHIFIVHGHIKHTLTESFSTECVSYSEEPIFCTKYVFRLIHFFWFNTKI